MSPEVDSDQDLRQDMAEMRAATSKMIRLLEVFVRESSRALQAVAAELVSSTQQGSARVEAGDPAAPGRLEEQLADHVDKVIAHHHALAAKGQLETVEFTADSAKQAAGSRLRRVAQERGISQKELAARLNVTPSVISRVFKRPERSRVETLRKIAHALGVELHEIV